MWLWVVVIVLIVAMGRAELAMGRDDRAEYGCGTRQVWGSYCEQFSWYDKEVPPTHERRSVPLVYMLVFHSRPNLFGTGHVTA